MVKRLPAMWETRVQFLGREGPLEKEMATHSSVLATALIMFLSIESCGPHKTDFFSLTCFIYFPEIDSNVSYLPHSVNIDL